MQKPTKQIYANTWIYQKTPDKTKDPGLIRIEVKLFM
jgi:hypothetical protein